MPEPQYDLFFYVKRYHIKRFFLYIQEYWVIIILNQEIFKYKHCIINNEKSCVKWFNYEFKFTKNFTYIFLYNDNREITFNKINIGTNLCYVSNPYIAQLTIRWSIRNIQY